MKLFTLLSLLVLSYAPGFAQPVNDACTNPTLITNVTNFCSANGAGSTAVATDDAITGTTYSAPTCWGAGTVNDVYYSFVAIATDVTIVINGNQGSPVGGTITRPQVALYSGGCGGNELVCASAPSGQNIVQIYRGGLTIGQTYLIRVDGFNTNKGTFQYCINNYNPVPAPQSDCQTAVVLCDKSNFSVQSVIGAGTNNTEMNGAACFQYDIFTGNVETNSSWYVFTFANSGTFTFNLNPSNPNDDLDFAVYRLPNGIGNCSGKVTTRCMASSCAGSTGLNTSSTDTEEPPGCAFPQNNFVSQINVTAGQTYAIAINNFTSTGNGFNISFGGTANIQGPTAIINDNDADDLLCVGETITYTDASTAPPAGSLVSWVWNFGVGAVPATFTGNVPPPVTYTSTGIKTITLTVKSDKGCLVTSTRTFTVNGIVSGVSIAASQNNVCANTNITFTATPVNGGTNPIYQWYKNNVLITGVSGAIYTTSTLANNDIIKAVMTSNANCVTGSPATSNQITMVITPGTPVSVSIAANNNNICPGTSVTFTATPSLNTLSPTYQWYKNGVLITGAGGATYTSNTLANNDIITAVMTSSAACISGSPATSNPVTMIVNPAPVITVNSPSICNGSSAILTANGATTYIWNTGATGNTITVSPVITTNYTVTGTTTGCTSLPVTATVTVKSIPIVTVNSDTICNGQSSVLTANGATTYLWNTGSTNASITVNPSITTIYTVTGTTAGCPSLPKTATVTVNSIPPVVIVNSPTICSGQSAVLTASGATSYLWNTGATGSSISVSPSITTSYSVTGTTLGCSAPPVNLTVTVNPKPVINVTSVTICNGQTTILSASGASTYIWNTGATGASISVNPSVNTTYTVTGTTLNCPSLPKNGIVTVNAIPTVTVNSPAICNGQTATLTASGATAYLWNNGSTNSSITVSPTITTNYSVVGTSAGCPSLPKNTSVTVNPIPVVTVNSPTICSGRSATLTAVGATTYSWSNGATTSAITVSPNSTAIYTVTGTSLNCPSLPKTSTVTVNPTPVVAVNSTIICQGDSAILTASGADTYSWSNGLTGNTINVSPLLTTTYTVTGTSLSCPSIPKNAVVTVSTSLVPTVTITQNKNDICFGTPITFTASVNGTGITPTYQWFVNGIPSGNNNSQFTSANLNNGDNVQVEITTTFRCSQPKTARSNIIKAIVSKVLYNKTPLSYCKNDSAIIDTSILKIHPTPDPEFTIIWKNGNNITTDTVINYTVSNLNSGNIPFTIKFGNNCSVNDVMTVNVKPLPAINAVVNIPRAKYEQEVQLDVLTNQNLSYNWSPSVLVNIDSVKNPTSVIKSSAQFTVIVQDFNTKCINKDTVFVELINECTKDFIYVPTGFSPNNDGVNDCFSILSPPKLSDFNMIIFDRWNEKVFETNSEKECWNGTFNGVIAATDTYSYIISFKCYNGTVLNRKGTISIIR